MPDPQRLQQALNEALSGNKLARLSVGVNRLRAAYRSQQVPEDMIVSTDDDAAAYAAYRMPATHAAVRACLSQAGSLVDLSAVASVVDLGAGTGAASWAVHEFVPASNYVMLEQSCAAAGLGRELASRSSSPALRSAEWRPWKATAGRTDVPAADLAVAAYLLAELDEATRRTVLDAAISAARVVLVVEPGTPAGYERVIEARRRLVDSGMTLVAPCPHEHECPLLRNNYWCHFAARVVRSERHRKVKGAVLNYEDEKFSFVMAVRGPRNWEAPEARVIRRPVQRKGLVAVELCRSDGNAGPEVISKRQGDDYKAARRLEWGGTLPAR